MDSAAKILLKYVENIISRGISATSIQLDPKFGKKTLLKFLIADTLGSYSMVQAMSLIRTGYSEVLIVSWPAQSIFDIKIIFLHF
jgi:hypothetical protein